MAVTAATTTGSFSGFINREMAQPIFERAAQQSVVMQLANEIPLGPPGVAIPVVSGKLTAGWVAEGAQKPASSGAMTLKTMDPKKIAVIAVVSAEVVRANPGNYMNVVRNQVGEAFAIAFDAAALHGTSTPFSTYIDQTTNAVEIGTTTQANGGVYGDFNAGLTTLVNAGKRLTGWALDSRLEPLINGATDTTGRPIFVESPVVDNAGPVRQGRLLGRPAFIGDGVYKATGVLLGYAGDWTQAAWGVVGGINYDVSTETAVTINGALVSLWENNLVAIRAEAEYGWLVNDTAAFVKYANAV
jgi:HK97 family phage major capsid protein